MHALTSAMKSCQPPCCRTCLPRWGRTSKFAPLPSDNVVPPVVNTGGTTGGHSPATQSMGQSVSGGVGRQHCTKRIALRVRKYQWTSIVAKKV
jgi:hypothetical protein